jgi:hypothetical protein
MTDIDNPIKQELLANQRFVSGNHALRVLFNEFVSAIEGLRRPGDRFELPSVAQLFAGRAIVELYRRVHSRERNAPQRVSDAGARAGPSYDLPEYVRIREKVRELVHYKKVTWQELYYFGVRRGDLDDLPAADERGWIEVEKYAGPASRLALALGRLESISAEERAAIPHAIQLQRLESERQSDKQKLAALEARVAAFEAGNNVQRPDETTGEANGLQ